MSSAIKGHEARHPRYLVAGAVRDLLANQLQRIAKYPKQERWNQGR